MKTRLFTEDSELSKNLITGNPHLGENAIPTIEILFGPWENCSDQLKEAILGYTARFCSDVFRAFLLDSLHLRQGSRLGLGQGAVENALDVLEKRIREAPKSFNQG